MVVTELRSSNVPISLALRDHVTRRVDFAIRRFAHRVERVVVRITDLNGPKGGLDKRCRIVARLSPARSVVVEATDADAYVAVSQAAIRLDERVSRALARCRQRASSKADFEPASSTDAAEAIEDSSA
ncbi:MAG TPA: HPF/RaiA family ribosome-associated protein [Labilithrix sp.]|nr:HPF/RaiA family ribosome-associated protein [Labilithrix sp.]